MSNPLIESYRKFCPEGSIPLFIGTDNQANIGFPCTKTFRLLIFCYPITKYLSISPAFKQSYTIQIHEPNEYLYIVDFRFYLQLLAKGKFDLSYYLASPDAWKHDYWLPAQWMELLEYTKLANRISPHKNCTNLLTIYQPSSINPLPILMYKLFQLRAILFTDRIFHNDPLPNPNLMQLKQYQSCESLIDSLLPIVYAPQINPSQSYLLTDLEKYITKMQEKFQRETKNYVYPSFRDIYQKGDKILTELLFTIQN